MKTPISPFSDSINFTINVSLDDSTVRLLARRIAEALTVEQRIALNQRRPAAPETPVPDRTLLMTQAELAKALCLSRRHVYSLTRSGQLPPPIMSGRAIRYSR